MPGTDLGLKCDIVAPFSPFTAPGGGHHGGGGGDDDHDDDDDDDDAV